ncbi:hypothetical protein GCM10023093_05440 [Nemorincola caseinilytica]|uniref:HTH araC/xylS-type domain-containing protein n=1 Tax=Nemorincola caseinilytica TaxID=2054315 RepID=A0ABP8N8U2_9BACT
MTLYIRNMVCNRCKASVQGIFEAAGIHPQSISLGEVVVADDAIAPALLQQIAGKLSQTGFELIDDRKGRMIERIKNVIVDLVHYTDDRPREKYSEILSRELHYDYSYLSKLFSEVEGITIEQYIIAQKTEKVKEYLVYDELSLGQIAEMMGYSSVAHLSAQFKKVTGMSPSEFKKLGIHHRKPLDEVGK